MPRDGSNIYHRPPGTDAITNTTIASAPYNSYVADVEQDLNLPRPIVAGGTGASSATQALFNLSGETATQVVTNWDSQLWLPGSFYAATTATGTAPVTGHAFAGICYLNEPLANPPTNKNLVVEATDLTDSANTKYIRVMTAGVWSAWVKTGATSPAGTLGEYTFDTGTSFPPASGTVRFNNATQNSTTELFISHLTANGVDVTGSIPLFKAGNDIAIQDKNSSNSYKIFTATAGPVISGGDCRILVTARITGLDLANTARLLVNVPGGPAVRYDAPQGLTTNQQAQARANINVAKKNYVINGAMQISQELGGTGAAGSGLYALDQWMFGAAGPSVGGAQGSAGISPPSGNLFYFAFTTITGKPSFAAGDFTYVQQYIEGYRVAELQYGTASAKTTTLSFAIRAPVAGTYCVFITNADVTRTYLAEYVIAPGEVGTTVVKSITIPGDVTGTWPKDNTKGITVGFCFGCGTTYGNGVVGWQAGQKFATANQVNAAAVAQNVNFTDVSLTEGSVAPPFQVPDYAGELAACRRYYRKYALYYVIATVTGRYTTPLDPVMRSGPTITGGGAGFSVAVNDPDNFAVSQTTAGYQPLVLNARL